MRLWVSESERRPDPAPARTDARKALLAGTAAWVVALLASLAACTPLLHRVRIIDDASSEETVVRLSGFMADKPWAQRTVVIVTSDHGEAFGEHKLIRHGFEIWEELVRVPLIVRAPGAAPKHVPARRSAIDLVPTILDLYGVKIAGQAPDDFVSGVSLAPELFAPDVFTLLDDGLAYVKEGSKIFAAAKGNPQGAEGMAEIPDGQLDGVIESAEECPGECIFIEP